MEMRSTDTAGTDWGGPLRLYGESIGILKTRVDSIEESLAKLTEISRDMKEIVVVQQTKMLNHEKNEDRLQTMLERENALVQQNISAIDKSIRNEIDARHNDIARLLAEMKLEQKEHHAQMAQNLKEIRNEFKKDFDSADKRLVALEKWRWIIVGGMLVVVFLVNITPVLSALIAAN